MERIDIYSIIRKLIIVFENLVALFFLGLIFGAVRLIIGFVKFATIPGRIKSKSKKYIVSSGYPV